MANDEVLKKIADTTVEYKREAETAKLSRMVRNRKNYEFFHLQQDFSHKTKGQSKEFLPRQAMAIEQIAQFLHQGLVDFGDWFSVEMQPGVKEPLFSETEIRDIVKWQLKEAGFFTYLLDQIKSGLIGSLMIAKVNGEMVRKKKFEVEEGKLLRTKNKVWRLKLDSVKQRNFYPDPTNEELYKVEEIEMDIWKLEMLVKLFPDEFDSAEFRKLKDAIAGSATSVDSSNESAETNQNETNSLYRNRVKLLECHGNIIDPMTGELLYEQKRWIVANDKYIIMRPKAFSNWLDDDPYIVAALIRSPFSVWHKALADAPTLLNQALNEIFNLVIDGGLQAVFGIKQIREHWLENPAEVSDGISAGMTLGVNQACPPGAKVLERVDTGTGANEGVNAFNLASGEFNQSALQNDLRVGTLPPRAVKATEVVEASQSITSVFTGIGKALEFSFVQKLLEKSWAMILQNLKKLDEEKLKAILGDKKVESLFKMSDKDIFARTVGSFSFSVFGITQTLNRIKDFRKLTSFLQTVATNPQLMEAFIRKYDFTKLLGEIVKALDINEDRILQEQVEQTMNEFDQMLSGQESPEGLSQTQIPQAASGASGEQEPGQISGLDFAAGGV